MEVLAIACSCSSYLPTPSLSPSNSRVANSRPASSIFLSKEPPFLSKTARPRLTTIQKRHSDSYLARQSAILQVQKSTDFESTLERFGETLKVQDLNAILRHFGMLNQGKDLSQIFDWMRQNGKIDVSSYSSYIKFMGRSLGSLKALEIYNSITDTSIKNNIFICNSVLSCLVRNGNFDSGIKLFNQMKADGLSPDVVTYSTLLAGCIKVKHRYSKSLELVYELRSNGMQMDDVIYGTLIAVCATHHKWQEAESYFKQMNDEGHSPNVFHYASLLNAYSAGGDYIKAEKLVQDMKSAGLVPNKVILTTLLKVYVKGGLFEKSRMLLSELESLGYAKDEMPFCLLMDGLAKARRIEEAKAVFDEMKAKQVTSDGYSYSIMISAFCRDGLLDEAKQLAKDFEAAYDRYDLVMLNTLLCAYCKSGEIESVIQLLRKMDQLAISPDYSTFHILIKYFCKQKLHLLAYKTMMDMHSKGHLPEEELCSSLMYHLGKMRAYSEAFSVYKILRYSKRTMCKALHEKILHILIAGNLLKNAYVVVKDNAGLISSPSIKKFGTNFMKAGDINLINDVMKAIHGSGNQIDQDLFQLGVRRYIENPEKKELFFQLLRWMPGQGYVLDSSTRNLILKNSHLFGRRYIAEILSEHHFLLKDGMVLKQEISEARIKLVKPILEGPDGVEYLRNAFTDRFGSVSGGWDSLPRTVQWLSSVSVSNNEEWEEHKNAVLTLGTYDTSSHGCLPSTTLRTGGGTTVTISACKDSTGYELLDCNGEKVDLLVRLGLLKLVTRVSGLTQEELQETLSLNLSRLRAIQAQIQEVIVITIRNIFYLNFISTVQILIWLLPILIKTPVFIWSFKN